MMLRHASFLALLLCLACQDDHIKSPNQAQDRQSIQVEKSEAKVNPEHCCTEGNSFPARLIGRHEIGRDGALRIAWSGAGLSARFEGTGLAMVHNGPRVRFALAVDGRAQPDVFFKAGTHRVILTQGLPNGSHTLTLLRQSEALFGTSEISGLEVLDGKFIDSPQAPARRIEIYGDSITCGYGNEGKNASCGFSAETESHQLSYGAILAHGLSAELSTIAWSGRGVARNYGGEIAPTLVDLAERAIPQDENSLWSFKAENAPQAIIINLGTNDYSTEPDPSDDVFIEQYDRLLSALRRHYPDAFVLCTVGPLLAGSDLETARRNIATVVARRTKGGDTKLVAYEMSTTNTNPGCDWHPGLATHQKMADELLPVIKNALAW